MLLFLILLPGPFLDQVMLLAARSSSLSVALLMPCKWCPVLQAPFCQTPFSFGFTAVWDRLSCVFTLHSLQSQLALSLLLAVMEENRRKHMENNRNKCQSDKTFRFSLKLTYADSHWLIHLLGRHLPF